MARTNRRDVLAAGENKDGSPAEPTEFELSSIRNDTRGLKEKRVRLSSASWFMRFLSERVAKEANKQDQCSGRFWETRYKIQPLLDEMAIAACMAYVDLNPIRAGIAATPDSSDFTSVQERIIDRQSAAEVSTADAKDQRIEHGECAGWLSPIDLDPRRKKVREKQTTRPASNKGCLQMTLDEYLKLLDWTGRQLRRGKAARIPAQFAPIQERLDCSAETWLDLVKNFRKRFRTEAGGPSALQGVSSLRRSCRHANSSA